MKNKSGFTLIEILVSVGILAIALTSTLQILKFLNDLTEQNNISVICTNHSEGIISAIRNLNFDDVISAYDGRTFTIPELTALNINHSGLIRANEIEANFLIRVKVVVCYQQKNRFFGEDINFNNLLDSGEDLNNNGEIDSPCTFETVIVDTER
ncbi:MAG: type II secretion system protein [Candidatus Omnitrophota bacterium]